MSSSTENSTLISGIHGRLRRAERNIEKIDLQRARRYGMKESARHGRDKYTYGGIVFIYDPRSKREVTSFESRDIALETSGTKSVPPVILPKKDDYVGTEHCRLHDLKSNLLLGYNQKEKWTSHSVLVVDMSGSMRRDDVNGGRCRSDAVWMVLARDFIQKPLENKTRSDTDVISVIVMRESADIVIKCEPVDWVLFNKLVDMREWNAIRPQGPGNYLPALDAADSLLELNQSGKCSLCLTFFSDGKPSDYGNFAERIGLIASKFGRRLAFTCIGMAEDSEDFSTLNEMVTEAQSYGAIANFGKPSLDADSLSKIITSTASSLTTSKTELTELITGNSRNVRMDITREKMGGPDDECVTDEWETYTNKDSYNYISNIWSWDYKENDWELLFDRRCFTCYKDTGIKSRNRESEATFSYGNCFVCPFCQWCCFCPNCWKRDHSCSSSLQRVRLDRISHKEIPSYSVAMKRPIFGEGAERIVHKFRYLDDNKNFIGPVMVAKESRFVEKDIDNRKQMMAYQSDFMRTQAIASEMAKLFNESLDKLVGHFSSVDHMWASHLPRIIFVEPLVVEVRRGRKEYNILIEPMLQGKYEKFNNNMGYVKNSVDGLCGMMQEMNFGIGQGLNDSCYIIEEGSEEEDSNDDNSLFDDRDNGPEPLTYRDVKDHYFPQAFSHFSYEKSKKRFMVVDLQGVFKINADGSRVYELTDPVVHKHKKRNKNRFSQWNFGRTDRGKKGMEAFFHTHVCTDVCKLLGLEETKY